MTFIKFSMQSMKARMYWLQDVLDNLGYDVPHNGKRDRLTVKSLMEFQKSHGITPNGVICERTYDELCNAIDNA